MKFKKGKDIMGTLGSRIKKIRKDADLTQVAFAEKIGIRQNSIALIESDKRGTSDQLIKSICREFNINEDWLRNGIGEPFRQLAPEQEMESYIEKMLSGESKEFKRRLLNILSNLNENQWLALQHYLEEILASKRTKTETDLIVNFQKLDDLDKGKVIGCINNMLDDDKYSAKDGSESA